MGFSSEFISDMITKKLKTVLPTFSKQNADSERMKATDDFNEQHKDGENPAQTFMMSMYMLGAMEYFEGMPMSEIKKIAF